MKKVFKAFLWILLALFICLFLAAAILPSWVSTESGQKTAVRWVNHLLPGELTVNSFSLSWTGKQEIKNFQYSDSAGKKILTFDHFETKTSLFYILAGGKKWNETRLLSPYLFLKKNGESKGKSRGANFLKIPDFKELNVENGAVLFESQKLTPISISDIQIVKEHQPDLFHIKAKTEQDNLQGEILVSGSFDERLHLLADVKNFPVIALDQFMHTSAYTNVLGDTISLQIKAEKQAKQTKVEATITATNLKGTIQGHTAEKRFVIEPSDPLLFTLTPTLFESLFPGKDWVLANKPALALTIQEGSFPLDKRPNMNNVLLKATGSLERAELSHKILGPYSLNNFTFTLAIDQKIHIEYKGEVLGKEKSQLSGNIVIDETGKTEFNSEFNGFPYSLLSLFSVKESETLKSLFSENINLKVIGKYEQRKTELSFHLASLGLNAHGRIFAPSLDKIKFSSEGEKLLPGKKGEFLGKTVQFNIEGIASISEGTFSIPFIIGKLHNPFLEISVRGNLGEHGKPFSFKKSHLIAEGILFGLPLEEHGLHAMIKRGSLSIHADGEKNLITGKAEMIASIDAQGNNIESKSLEFQFDVKDLIAETGDLDLEGAHSTFQASLNRFPVTILSMFVPEEVNLPLLIGPLVNLKAAGAYTPTKEPHFEMEVDAAASGFIASFSLAMDDTSTVRQPKPGFISWDLTPQRYQNLTTMLSSQDPHSHFTLMQTARIDLKFDQLTCPATLPEKVSNLLCQSGFTGSIEVAPLFFKEQQSTEYFSVQNLRGDLSGRDFSKEIYLDVRGDIFSPEIPSNERSGFSFRGNMFNFWNQEGKFNRENLAVDGELSLELIPIVPLTKLFPLDSETTRILWAVLGPLANARVTGNISQMSGPLIVDVKSSNFKAVLPLQLSPHSITLRESVEAEITLTEAISETLLADINPLLITGAYSDHPLKLYINPEGFFIPIRPYSFRGVQIVKGMLNIGKIQVRNGGQLQTLMNFLKAREVTPDGLMGAWFTPIYFSLNDGVSTYQRFDILLADNFHIAFWGHVDLLTNRVNMTLGIAPTTLRRRFNVLGLSKKDMFQVKMRGTTDQLDLDWSSASTRIGILIASSAGGHIGFLVGGIVEQIVTALGEESAPPPTTTPFPWQEK